MSPDRLTLQSNDYKVALLCALQSELIATMSILDEEHDVPLSGHQNCDDIYTFGKIGKHNAIIACLAAGDVGSVAAASLARGIKVNFPSIKVGLLVGIGGGIPNEKTDIRLGDVVVSRPTDIHGGVIQWDFGKTGSKGMFERRGQLDRPPELLRKAVSILEARRWRGTTVDDFEQRLGKIHSSNPKMRATYRHQGIDNDRLFYPADEHLIKDVDCNLACDCLRIKQREPRNSDVPVVHYGNIASGSQVIAHAGKRDQLQQELGVLCVEMEAAGLQNDFPCLVIKGICDYADTHKNDKWQDYAAITAAMYAKELLAIVPNQDLSETNDLFLAQRSEYRNTTPTPQDSGVSSSTPPLGQLESRFYGLDSSPEFLPRTQRLEYRTPTPRSSGVLNSTPPLRQSESQFYGLDGSPEISPQRLEYRTPTPQSSGVLNSTPPMRQSESQFYGLDGSPENLSWAQRLENRNTTSSTANASVSSLTPSTRRYDSPFYRLDDSPEFIKPLTSTEKERYWTRLTQTAFDVYEMVYDQIPKTPRAYVQFSSFVSHFEINSSLKRKIPIVWNRFCTVDLCAPRGYILAMLFMLHLETQPDFLTLQPRSHSNPRVAISPNGKAYIALWGEWVDCSCGAVLGRPACGCKWAFPVKVGFARESNNTKCLVLKSRQSIVSSRDQSKADEIHTKNTIAWRNVEKRIPVKLEDA